MDRLGLNQVRDITPDGEASGSRGESSPAARGNMVHIDVTNVGKLRDGGGRWAHGRGSAQDKKKHAQRHSQRIGYPYPHSMTDGFSRQAHTEALDDEKAVTTIAFFHRVRVLFAAHRITRISRLVTLDGVNYTAKAFARSSCAFLGKHQRPRMYTLRHSGTIERYQRLLAEACLYAHPYGAETERREAIAGSTTTTTIALIPPAATCHRPHASTSASTTSTQLRLVLPHGELRTNNEHISVEESSESHAGLCHDPRTSLTRRSSTQPVEYSAASSASERLPRNFAPYD